LASKLYLNILEPYTNTRPRSEKRKVDRSTAQSGNGNLKDTKRKSSHKNITRNQL